MLLVSLIHIWEINNRASGMRLHVRPEDKK